jgi:hypothetical protein
MKRHLLRSGLLVIAGAIVNVAVAWGCAARWPQRLVAPGTNPAGNGIPVWSVHWQPRTEPCTLWIEQHMPEGVLLESRWVAVGPGVVLNGYRGVTIEHHTEMEPSMFGAEQISAGWPLLSLMGGRWVFNQWDHVAIRQVTVNEEFIHALAVPDGGWRRVLPLGPIWPGFAINTILYAAILWGVFFGPGMVKRGLRRRRGLCPACAYPIGSSPVCTECGKPVRLANSGPQSLEAG